MDFGGDGWVGGGGEGRAGWVVVIQFEGWQACAWGVGRLRWPHRAGDMGCRMVRREQIVAVSEM